MSEQAGNGGENWKMSDAARDQLGRPEVFVSFATSGEPRTFPDAERVVAAGNMSENWGQPGDRDFPKERYAEAARENVQKFLESLGVDPGKTAILRPQTDFSKPLGFNNVDELLPDDPTRKEATWLEQPADFIYTRDPNKTLGCRPADCPVVVIVAQDRTGQDVMLVEHLGWQSLNAGYAEQGFAYMRDELGLDFATMKVHIAPGARAVAGDAARSLHYTLPTNPLSDENPRFSHPDRASLFVNIEEVRREDGSTGYEFDIDAFGFMREQLRKAGVRDEQVYEDVSNTITPESGYSSHSRAANNRDTDINTRDLVVASMRPGAGIKKLK